MAKKKAQAKATPKRRAVMIKLSAATLNRLQAGMFGRVSGPDTTVTSCTLSISGGHWACTGLAPIRRRSARRG